jgi:predicted ArsR family transcriptional regulator
MTEAFGARGLDKLVAARNAAQRAADGARIRAHWPLKRRVEALAKIRAEEGYMAEARDGGREGGRGVYLLVENHCPICAAARACRGLCQRELELFQEVLGPDVAVERLDHLLSGARRCSYAIRRAPAR